MRRLTFLLILVPCLSLPCVFASGCGDDEMPLFIDLIYQVRCEDVGGCVSIEPRSVNNLNGEEGFTLRCSKNQIGDSVNLTFSADNNGDNPFTFELRNVRYTPGGGPVMGTSCQVLIEESGITYEGGCSSSEPTPMFPCRVRIMSDGEGMDGPTILGDIFCQGLPSRADLTITREVTAAGTQPGVRMTPAPFRIVNCGG